MMFIIESVLYFLAGAAMGAAFVMDFRVQQKRQKKK
jgi:hypothetical protein